MKHFNIFLVVFALLLSCKEQKDPASAGGDAVTEDQAVVETFTAVGDPLSDREVTGPSDMVALYEGMQAQDTVQTAFRGEVLEVCQAKGCWMRVALPDDRTVMVRFKDYGFFVPKDIAGAQVTVEGKAFVSVVEEEERRHLAEDGGAAPEAIEALVGPVSEPGFEASGVRIWQ